MSAHPSTYKFKKVTDVLVRSLFVRLLPSLHSVRFGQLFALTVHINALYNESVHGREEHATGINLIPLKMATLLTL